MLSMSNWIKKGVVWGVLALSISPLAYSRGPDFRNQSQITEIPLDGRVNMPLHMDFDSHGNLWVGAFKEGKMLRYTYNGEMQTYDVVAQNIDPASGPMNLYADLRDDSVWFSALGDYIVNLKVDGTVKTYSIPSAHSMPMGVRGDAQGNIWFAEMFTNKIGVVRPGGNIDEYDIPYKGALPTGLTVGPYGNVWFVMSGVGKIGVFHPNDGSFQQYNLPMGAHPMGISYNDKGQSTTLVWFTETVGNHIGSIAPLTGKITLYRIPTLASMPMMVMEDSMGDVYFTEMAGNQIGKLNVANGSYQMQEFKVPTMAAAPMGLSMNPRTDAMWFTEVMRNRLGVMPPMGSMPGM